MESHGVAGNINRSRGTNGQNIWDRAMYHAPIYKPYSTTMKRQMYSSDVSCFCSISTVHVFACPNKIQIHNTSKETMERIVGTLIGPGLVEVTENNIPLIEPIRYSAEKGLFKGTEQWRIGYKDDLTRYGAIRHGKEYAATLRSGQYVVSVSIETSYEFEYKTRKFACVPRKYAIVISNLT